MYKFIVLAAVFAYANAGGLIGGGLIQGGLIGAPALGYAASPLTLGHAALAPAAITSQQSNILRSYGNLGQVSTYSKTIDTPYSSVSKSDVRVSNPGLATVAHAPLGLAASPLLAGTAIAGPGLGLAASPLLARNVIAGPGLGLAASPLLARSAIAAPALATSTVHGAGLLGVAYSAAPLVSHMTYANSLGLQYGW